MSKNFDPKIGAATKFQPGHEYKARPRPWRDALMRVLARRKAMVTVDEHVQEMLALDAIAEQCVERALKGDKDSIMEIANRVDGKPAQQLVHTGDEEGGPVKYQRIERVIVDPARPPDATDTDGASVPSVH